MISIDLTLPQSAIFSPDGRYRYAIVRIWTINKPILLFIGINPSKAGAIVNDPTITRLMARAARNGFGGLLGSNLYALVSTDPKALLTTPDAIGLETDAYLLQMVFIVKSTNGKVLCGWGSFAPVKQRATDVLSMVPEPYCLGVNSDGEPKHPLYVGYDAPIIPLVR